MNKLLPLSLIALVTLAAALMCEPTPDQGASNQRNNLHPNTTSPDEQGESGSLIETEPNPPANSKP